MSKFQQRQQDKISTKAMRENFKNLNKGDRTKFQQRR